MKKRLSLTLGALALAGVSAAVLAAPGFGGAGDCGGDRGGHWGKEPGARGGHDEARGERMLEHLDRALSLSDAQKAQITALLESRRQEPGDLRQEHGAMREAMRALDPADADYEAKVAELVKQQTEAMGQRMMARAKAQAEIYALLTPEQQARYRALQRERDERHGHPGRWH